MTDIYPHFLRNEIARLTGELEMFRAAYRTVADPAASAFLRARILGNSAAVAALNDELTKQ